MSDKELAAAMVDHAMECHEYCLKIEARNREILALLKRLEPVLRMIEADGLS